MSTLSDLIGFWRVLTDRDRASALITGAGVIGVLFVATAIAGCL